MPHPGSGTVSTNQIKIQLSCYDLIYVNIIVITNPLVLISIDQGTYRISTVAMYTYRSLGKIQHEKFFVRC